MGISNYAQYDLISDLDNYALRLLYGMPLGGFNLGGEVQFAYRHEENENLMPRYFNYTLGDEFPTRNLTPFQLPYNSSYWEALLKGSLEGKVGPLDLEFTLRAGFIFGGDDNWLLTEGTASVASNGDVTGWRIGGDLWARYPLAEDLTLPILVRLDYQEKIRSGVGIRLDPNPNVYPYDSEERSVHLEVGGGLDKEFGQGTRVGAGVYYNYLQGDYYLKFVETDGTTWRPWDHRNYPASTEHQVMVRLAGEVELSPAVTLRMGFAPFFGWVNEDFTFQYRTSYRDDISPAGYHWGIGASFGGSIKFKPITLEPFFNVNYQQLNLDGNGDRVDSAGTVTGLWDMDRSRKEWSIGGGLSVLFDLP